VCVHQHHHHIISIIIIIIIIIIIKVFVRSIYHLRTTELVISVRCFQPLNVHSAKHATSCNNCHFLRRDHTRTVAFAMLPPLVKYWETSVRPWGLGVSKWGPPRAPQYEFTYHAGPRMGLHPQDLTKQKSMKTYEERFKRQAAPLVRPWRQGRLIQLSCRPPILAQLHNIFIWPRNRPHIKEVGSALYVHKSPPLYLIINQLNLTSLKDSF
jgi:hypothetical protein